MIVVVQSYNLVFMSQNLAVIFSEEHCDLGIHVGLKI